MSDITTVWDVARGRGAWVLAGPILQSGDDLSTAVLNSLFTDRQATASDSLPDSSGDRRGWWGDDGQTALIGSRLWLLDRAKLTTGIAATAKGYITEALQWLVADGVAVAFTVTTAVVQPSMLTAEITINQSNGTQRALSFNWAWNQLD